MRENIGSPTICVFFLSAFENVFSYRQTLRNIQLLDKLCRQFALLGRPPFSPAHRLS